MSQSVKPQTPPATQPPVTAATTPSPYPPYRKVYAGVSGMVANVSGRHLLLTGRVPALVFACTLVFQSITGYNGNILPPEPVMRIVGICLFACCAFIPAFARGGTDGGRASCGGGKETQAANEKVGPCVVCVVSRSDKYLTSEVNPNTESSPVDKPPS